MLTLFKRNNKETSVATATTPPQAIDPPQPVPISISHAEDASMILLAKELGVERGVVSKMELLAFLRDEGIPTYSTKSVKDHLVMKNNGAAFRIYGARESDLKTLAERKVFADGDFWKQPGAVPYSAETYGYHASYPIPYPVLLTMKRIVEKFGDDVNFFVAAIDADPLLAVSLRGSGIIFVERWEEPEFRN